MALHLTTNVSLESYSGRTGKIAEFLKPQEGSGKELYGIEIFLLPANYENKYSLELPEGRAEIETIELPKGSKSRMPVLSQELAKDIGRTFGKFNVRKFQVHYPWEKDAYDMGGMHIGQTFQFVDIIKDISGADQANVNMHYTTKYPIGSVISEKTGKEREEDLEMIERQAMRTADIRDQLGSSCKIILENNSSAGKLFDKKTGRWIVDNFDFVAEDYAGRRGADGNNWDYSHAWCAIGALNGDRICPTMEWCKRQYNGMPESGRSIQEYARKVAPNIEWAHLCDEASPYAHHGLHVGEVRKEGGQEIRGMIDFNECAEALGRVVRENPKKDIVATIEVKDGHLQQGFEKIINHDYPILKSLLEREGVLAS
jgi:hypothetical protein